MRSGEGPFVLETFGWVGSHADKFLQSVAVASGIVGAYKDLRERLAAALQRGNALLARRGLDLVNRTAVGAPTDHAVCLVRDPRRKRRRP